MYELVAARHWSIYSVNQMLDHEEMKKNTLFKKKKKALNQPLTFFSTGVEILDVVVEADSDGGEAHLSLQPRHQPVVQRPGPLCSDHGADGPEHAFVADASHRDFLSLNLWPWLRINFKEQKTQPFSAKPRSK